MGDAFKALLAPPFAAVGRSAFSGVSTRPVRRPRERISVATHCFDDFDSFTAALIRIIASRLAARSEFGGADRDLIEDQLRSKLLLSKHLFDPARGTWRAFARSVLMRHAASLLRARRAKKRSPGASVSLSIWIKLDGEPIEFAGTIGRREYNARRLTDPLDDEEGARLRQDVGAILEKLPPSLYATLNELNTLTNPRAFCARAPQQTGNQRFALFNSLKCRT